MARLLSHRLFGGTPALFSGQQDAWIDWRCRFAEQLAVDDHSILLVGSAAFGVSLNPHKDFAEFTRASDIDVAVLSQRHFDLAWFELREMRDKRWLSMSRSVKNELKNFAPNYVFAGCIATDKLIASLSFGAQWLRALTDMAGHKPTIGRDIKLRIYRDAEALRAYQLRSFRAANETLVAAGGP